MENSMQRLLLFCIISIFFSGCWKGPPQGKQIIRIKGSDTMSILMKNLAQSYMTNHPSISIYVEGGGTASGVSALIEGDIEICSASRLLTADEASSISSRYRNMGVYHHVAKDALSVYVHPDNPVKNLTLKQLKQIFSGEITNWLQLTGPDLPIEVIIRPPNSGTHQYFKEHILQNEPYTSSARTIPTTLQIVNYVMEHPGAIGYGGIAFGPDSIHCRINSIPASADNVRFDLYPISRYLYLYTIKKPKGAIQDFLDWSISREGQKIVEETGFISLWPDE